MTFEEAWEQWETVHPHQYFGSVRRCAERFFAMGQANGGCDGCTRGDVAGVCEECRRLFRVDHYDGGG